MKRGINEAWTTLCNRLWNTPWCVNIGTRNGQKCLILSSCTKAEPPKRKTRKLKTWMGYPVVFETGQEKLFNERNN